MDHSEFSKIWHKRKANVVNICFLCGDDLGKKNKSKEHIFPKWLLKKMKLWNGDFILQNKTSLKYRKATVPCCKKCNNTNLSILEKEIRENLEKGYDEFISNVDKIRIYQWCLGIFYKIILKETFLNSNIRNKDSPKIVSDNQFKFLSLNHLMLRSIDKKINFENFFPGSIAIVKTQIQEDFTFCYDFIEHPALQTFAMRINDIGFIVVFNDAEIISELLKTDESTKELLNKELNPTEFRILYAKFLYARSKFQDPFFYYLDKKKRDSVRVSIHLKPNVMKEELFSDYNKTEYKKVLEYVFKMRLPDVN